MDIEASYNFRRMTEKLTTSGIVQPDGLKALRAQGYEVVINLLPDTGRNAIPNERDIVESQGIEYIYIPVDFKQPTSADLSTFSEALDRVHEKKSMCTALQITESVHSTLFTWLVAASGALNKPWSSCAAFMAAEAAERATRLVRLHNCGSRGSQRPRSW